MQYSVTELGTLGGTQAHANSINAAGQVAGYASIRADAARHSFLWQAGSMLDVGTLGGTYSHANGINAAAQVVGFSATAANATEHAFLWQSGSARDLGTLGGTYSYAAGINAAGQVVGDSSTSTSTATHAFLWQSGSMRDLGTLGGTYSSAYAINAAGQVVGYSETGGGSTHAFAWQSGSMRDLGTLGGEYSSAYAINAAGQVIGTASISDGTAHAFVWQSGSMRDLGTLRGGASTATGINAAGQVVGYADYTGGLQHAFVGTAQGGLTDLNALLVADSGATILQAAGINDSGQIIGQATTLSGQNRAVLLTPTGSVTWQAGSTGASFNDAANWEQGFGPSRFIGAVIAPVGSQTINAGSDAAVKSLSLGSSSGSSGRPLLVLQNGANLTAIGGVTVHATGTLAGDGKISGNLVNLGTVRAGNLSVAGSFTNAGLVQGDGYINTNLNNAAGGLVRSGAGQTLHIVGVAHSNAGTVEVTDGGALAFDGTFSNAGSGRVFLKSGQLHFAGGASNAGQINVTFGTSDVHGGLTNLNGGKVILSGNSHTTFYDGVDVQPGAELRVSNGSTAVFFGQVLQRTGSVFSGTGTKFYEGGLSVGASPGLGVDSGDVSFGSGNVYLAEIGGLAAGTGFDKYEVAGTLGFGGTLKVVWWGRFTGQAGQSFDLFDWGSSHGTFAGVDLSGATLAAGLAWDTSKLYADGELSISAVPEPQTWGLLLAGLGVVGGAARRRAQAGSGASAR